MCDNCFLIFFFWEYPSLITKRSVEHDYVLLAPSDDYVNLTKVTHIFTLSHRGSDNSQLMFMCSANYIRLADISEGSIFWLFDIWIDYVPEMTWKSINNSSFSNYCTAFEIRYLLCQRHDAICKYKVHINFGWTKSLRETYQILYAIA